MDLIDIYSKITYSEIDSDLNFIKSLDYLDKGIKIAEALLYIVNNNDNIQLSPIFRCEELYPDNINLFELCCIKGDLDKEIKHNELCEVHKLFNGLISIEIV